MIADESPRDLVAHGYDRVAEAYARLEDAGDWPRMRWLAEVLRRLPGPGRVLDLGCGNGLPATTALAQRHTVTGVDVSARQIELARGNVPGAQLLVADVLDLRFPAGSFDAVVAFYTFDHLPRAQLPDLFGRIHDWLGERGLLLFSVETEDQPGTVGQWLGVPMFFSCNNAGTTRRLVREAGFDLILDQVESQREGDTDVEWLWILARKPGRSPVLGGYGDRRRA